jgi:acyl carrier protein
MTESDFLLAVDELLEVDPGTVTFETSLSSLEAWDSLAVLSFIAMADERLGIEVAPAQLADAKTVADLKDLVAPRLG